MMLALCPGKHQLSCPTGWGRPGLWRIQVREALCPSPAMWCGAGRGGWGAPSGQHQGVQHRIGTASLGTGAEMLRGQLQASVASHALWVQGWRPGSEKASLKVVRAKGG